MCIVLYLVVIRFLTVFLYVLNSKKLSNITKYFYQIDLISKYHQDQGTQNEQKGMYQKSTILF